MNKSSFSLCLIAKLLHAWKSKSTEMKKLSFSGWHNASKTVVTKCFFVSLRLFFVSQMYVHETDEEGKKESN